MSKSLLSEQRIIPTLLSTGIKQLLMDLKLGGRSRRTIEWYAYYLARFAGFMPDVFIHQIQLANIRTFMDQARTPYVLSHYYRSLRGFFSWAITQKYIQESPLATLKAPKLPNKIMPTLAPEQIQALIDACGDNTRGLRDRAILFVLVDTGIRLNELVTLTLEDIDIEHGFLKVLGKGNKERVVRISPNSTLAVWNYIKRRGHPDQLRLWLSENNTPLTHNGVTLLLKRLKTRAGVQGRCNPHTFRHTFAVNYLRGGGDTFTLQTLLGHSSLEMVKRYSRSLGIDDALAAHVKFSPVERLGLK